MSSVLDFRNRAATLAAGAGALVDCCSEVVADRSGSDGQVAAWATREKPASGSEQPAFERAGRLDRPPALAAA